MNDQAILRDIQPTNTVDLHDEPEVFQAMSRGTFDLRYMAAAIRSNLLLISAIILVALGAALVITLLDTPRYTANATIQINDSSDRVIGENDDQTAQESNLYDVDRFLKTQTDILRSRGLALRVAQKLKLQDRQAFYEAMEVRAPAAGTSAESATNQVVWLLQQNLKVTLPRDSRIVTISFESANQDIAAEVANAFASEFIQANLQRKFDSSAYAREFVANQMAEAKQRVEQAERELNDYARSTGLIRTGDAAGEDNSAGAGGGSVTSASLIQLNAAANQATAGRVAAEGRWRAISSVPLLSSRETKLRLPLLGVVPKSVGQGPEDEMDDPKSPISEAYNSLRAALLYSTSAGLPQVMLVTSAQSGEGKTTTSFAAATGLARMGRKVVLIDADLRRPSLHRRLDLSNARGLTDLLTTSDPVESAIQASSHDNLFVIASGTIPPSPTELVSSPRMEQIVQELAKNYDAVVIDSPPILGLADAPVLSALADGVIFVVESNRNRRGSLKTALRRLRAMRPILLGAVLTKFDPTRSGNRYSEYYGYDYYTYEHGEPERGYAARPAGGEGKFHEIETARSRWDKGCCRHRIVNQQAQVEGHVRPLPNARYLELGARVNEFKAVQLGAIKWIALRIAGPIVPIA